MRYRRLGGSGLQVSAFALGTWVTFGHQVDRRTARELVACALERGVNFFDSAENYAWGAAETLLGDVLADLRAPREGWCVSSKVCFGSAEQPLPTERGLSRKHVTEACHQALRRLRVEHLDLFYCHRPDPQTPVSETGFAMDTLIRQGKVLYGGTSEWPAAAIREACELARRHSLHAPSMEQPQYNLLRRARVEDEYAPLYREYGLGTTVWSPLASGLLTGKYGNGIPAASRAARPGNEWLRERLDSREGRADLAKVKRVARIAAGLDVPLAQLALAWCLKNPDVSSVILGATSRDQLEQNLAALDVVDRLDAATMRAIDLAVRGTPREWLKRQARHWLRRD